MRAGFVAGALMALMDRGINCFDRAVAVSASVPTLAYFASGQRLEMESVWREELNTPKLVCYRNIPAASLVLSRKRPILDIDYLVYEVFKKKYPIHAQDLCHCRTACRFAVTRTGDGELVLLRPEKGDMYEIFRAALAIPGAYPTAVRVGEYEYVDGGTVNPLPAGWLFAEGVKKLLVVLTKPIDCEQEPPGFMERTLLWRYFKKYDWMVEKLWEAAQAYNDEVANLERLGESNPPQVYLINPDTTLPAKLITRDRRKINRTIDLGYRKVEGCLEEIEAFLEAGTPSV